MVLRLCKSESRGFPVENNFFLVHIVFYFQTVECEIAEDDLPSRLEDTSTKGRGSTMFSVHLVSH